MLTGRKPAPGNICGHGGIGRLGGFRFHCESVQVRVLLPAPNKTERSFDLSFLFGTIRTRTHLYATCQWQVAVRRSRRRTLLIYNRIPHPLPLDSPWILPNPGVSFCFHRFSGWFCAKSERRIFCFPCVFPYQLTDPPPSATKSPHHMPRSIRLHP